MLGNVVSQLHLHLVMRNKNDPAWPGPVWGYNFNRKLDNKLKKISVNSFLNLTIKINFF